MTRFPDSRTNPRPPGRGRGHRRELAARAPERRSFQDRLQASILDIAIHRALASRDLIEQQFGGHRYAGRRGIDHLKSAGLATEHDTRNPETRRTERYLVATPAGEELAKRIAGERGLATEQRTWSTTPKRADLHHDLAIYRAVAAARAAITAKGLHVRRYRLDAELRGRIVRQAEAARARRGPAAAELVRRELARHHHLPVDQDGRILYPDAQLEYAATPDGPSAGRINIDVVTDNYRGASIAAKAGAGFSLYPSGPKAAATLASAMRSLGAVGDRGGTPSGGRRGGTPGASFDF